MEEHEGWNIVELCLPKIGQVIISFKDDTIRIRKADNIATIRPIEFTFADRVGDKTSNLTAFIYAEIDR